MYGFEYCNSPRIDWIFLHIRVWVWRSDAKGITSSLSLALEIHKGVFCTPEPEIQPQTTLRNT